MPRFSETYTFSAIADSARIWIKTPEANDWGSPLIDHWPTSDSNTFGAVQGALAMQAHKAYDIRIEYRERTGAAKMRLLWASPSTP